MQLTYIYVDPHCCQSWIQTAACRRSRTSTQHMRSVLFGIGRKWNVHCKFDISFFFAKSTSETIQEPLSKISDQIRTRTHLFSRISRPTERKSATSVYFVQALALLRYLEHTADSIHFAYKIWAPATTVTLKT